MIEHTGKAIGSDESGEKRLLGDFGIILMRLDERLDVCKSTRLGEAPDGELLGVARGERGRVVFGNG